MPKAATKNSTASLRKTSPAEAPARPIVDPIFPNPAALCCRRAYSRKTLTSSMIRKITSF